MDEVSVDTVHGEFPDCLRALEPLTSGVIPRHLLVEASDDWTAYFNCGMRGTDAVSAIGHLTRTVGCQGLIIGAVPHTAGRAGAGPGRLGAVQFEFLGPSPTDFLNYIRTISVTSDGRRWDFDVGGAEQWFEEPETYKARRVRDRFTSEMLERYCRALGVNVFEPASYGPRAVLVHRHMQVPSGADISLDEAQRLMGIVPGQADGLPG